jgi:predicted amidohydrolase YtcJ
MVAAILAGPAAAATHAEAAAAADTVYRRGLVYTIDAHDNVQQALAIRAGRIVYVGSDAGLAAFVGPKTAVVDLQGRMLMPGLLDGHSHPLQGGGALLKCNLNYEQLGVAQMQARIQTCLDQTQAQEPNTWLEVVNWFQEGS